MHEGRTGGGGNGRWRLRACCCDGTKEDEKVIVSGTDWPTPFHIAQEVRFPAFLARLQRWTDDSEGALMKATGWQAHSVRGFLSGTIGKKMGLTVISTKGEDGERSYSVKA
jgi:hypothetical protein